MSSLFKRIDTVFLEVTDMERSIKWYTEVLGFSVRWHDEENGYAAIEMGETPLTLVRAEKVTPGSHCLLNFYSSEIYAAHQKLQESGVSVEDVMDYGTVLSFEFNDPDGHILGVCYFEEEPVTMGDFKQRLASVNEYMMIDPMEYLREKTTNLGEMKKLIHQAKNLLEKAEDGEDRHFLLGTLGNLHRVSGEPPLAIGYLTEYLEYAKKLEDVQKEIVGLIRLGEAVKYDGRQEEALGIFEAALLKCEGEKYAYLDFALQHKGKCLLELQRYEEAEACFKEALRLRKEKGDPSLIDSTQMAIDFIKK